MPTLTTSGRVTIAESIAIRAIHLAWGSGDGSWSEPPPIDLGGGEIVVEPVNATALLNEIGRRVATEVGYVVPDPLGDVVLPTGTFARSLTPTQHLLITADFDFAEAPSAQIREIAAFVGTEVDPLLPGGQEYFTPAELVSPGRMLHLEYFAPIFRSPAIRESFQVVVSF